MAKGKASQKTEDIIVSQSAYKGDSLHETVEVTITKANKYYKVGDVDEVHPATAAIFKKLGIIDSYEGEEEAATVDTSEA